MSTVLCTFHVHGWVHVVAAATAVDCVSPRVIHPCALHKLHRDSSCGWWARGQAQTKNRREKRHRKQQLSNEILSDLLLFRVNKQAGTYINQRNGYANKRGGQPSELQYSYTACWMPQQQESVTI